MVHVAKRYFRSLPDPSRRVARLVTLDLPQMEFADDAIEALAAITSAACEGKITPGEAANLAGLVDSLARAIHIADLVRRMEALEARINGTGA
jgi:hypothetical protein